MDIDIPGSNVVIFFAIYLRKQMWVSFSIPGAAGSPPDQGLSNAGGLCVQDLRAWKEAGVSNHIHNVSPGEKLNFLIEIEVHVPDDNSNFPGDHLQHLHAAVLLPWGPRQVRDFPLRLHLHVPDPHPGGLAGGHVKDNGGGEGEKIRRNINEKHKWKPYDSRKIIILKSVIRN